MSGLSAKTYSWGGEGSLLRGGGDISFFLASATSSLETRWKNFRIPFWGFSSISDSSPDGAGDKEEMEDRSDESSAILSVAAGKLVAVAVCRLQSGGAAGCGGRGKVPMSKVR